MFSQTAASVFAGQSREMATIGLLRIIKDYLLITKKENARALLRFSAVSALRSGSYLKGFTMVNGKPGWVALLLFTLPNFACAARRSNDVGYL